MTVDLVADPCIPEHSGNATRMLMNIGHSTGILELPLSQCCLGWEGKDKNIASINADGDRSCNAINEAKMPTMLK
ncbi:hypothetical protein D5086_004004 [Populus alba]|uniref:Uncharacterized protein n=1 Tax=Populus alba TaxID=43335 RepID=A0ACC4CP45_POPAL